MRSGSTLCRAGPSCATPSISMRDVPAPEIFAPILIEAIGDVLDLRLLRRVLDHGRAVGERRRHHRDMGAADGDFRKHDLAAAQPPFGVRATA